MNFKHHLAPVICTDCSLNLDSEAKQTNKQTKKKTTRKAPLQKQTNKKNNVNNVYISGSLSHGYFTDWRGDKIAGKTWENTVFGWM